MFRSFFINIEERKCIMSYSVICPSCNEKNSGSAFHCVKCNASLIGIPRQEEGEASLSYTTTSENEIVQAKNNMKIESIPSALWHAFQDSIIIFLVTSLFTALICWILNQRTLYEFGNALFYSGTVLAFVGWFIFKGNQQLVRSQTNPLNPMNRVMPGTHSERTRRYGLDHMEGMTSVSVIGVAVALCFGLAILIVNLAS